MVYQPPYEYTDFVAVFIIVAKRSIDFDSYSFVIIIGISVV